MNPPKRIRVLTCPPGHSNIPAILENSDFYKCAVRLLCSLLFEGDDRGGRNCGI